MLEIGDQRLICDYLKVYAGEAGGGMFVILLAG